MSELKVCPFPFIHCEIEEWGCFPCCVAWTKDVNYGDIFNNTAESVWNSERAKEFRRSVLDGSYSLCKRDICIFDPKKMAIPISQCNCESDGTMLRFPNRVKFCHDKSCNIHCTTCRDSLFHNSAEKSAQLDSKIETVFLPLLRDAEHCVLNGAGELFASKHCHKLIREAVIKYPNLLFTLHTNGLLCDEKHCSQLGILNKIDRVSVSIHAATEETYNKIALGSNFERVMENVRWLSQMKKNGDINWVDLIFVVQKNNWFEMKMFLEKAIELDASASFYEYRDWGNHMGKNYEDYAVFHSQHADYNNFVSLLKDKIFAHQLCNLSGGFRELRK